MGNRGPEARTGCLVWTELSPLWIRQRWNPMVESVPLRPPQSEAHDLVRGLSAPQSAASGFPLLALTSLKWHPLGGWAQSRLRWQVSDRNHRFQAPPGGIAILSRATREFNSASRQEKDGRSPPRGD